MQKKKTNIMEKQLTLMESYKSTKVWDISHPKSIEIHKKILKMIALDNQIPRDSEPLDWWRAQTEYPSLKKVAKKFLTSPLSSVYSERLFSEFGNIYEEKRSRLLPETGEKLLFLHHNLKLFK